MVTFIIIIIVVFIVFSFFNVVDTSPGKQYLFRFILMPNSSDNYNCLELPVTVIIQNKYITFSGANNEKLVIKSIQEGIDELKGYTIYTCLDNTNSTNIRIIHNTEMELLIRADVVSQRRLMFTNSINKEDLIF